MTCERHTEMAKLKGKTRLQIYDILKWIKCTCIPPKIWCDYCRGCAYCNLCTNRDGTPITSNFKYCPRCGGTQKCLPCKQTGEMTKK